MMFIEFTTSRGTLVLINLGALGVLTPCPDRPEDSPACFLRVEWAPEALLVLGEYEVLKAEILGLLGQHAA